MDKVSLPAEDIPWGKIKWPRIISKYKTFPLLLTTSYTEQMSTIVRPILWNQYFQHLVLKVKVFLQDTFSNASHPRFFARSITWGKTTCLQSFQSKDPFLCCKLPVIFVQTSTIARQIFWNQYFNIWRFLYTIYSVIYLTSKFRRHNAPIILWQNWRIVKSLLRSNLNRYPNISYTNSACEKKLFFSISLQLQNSFVLGVHLIHRHLNKYFGCKQFS